MVMVSKSFKVDLKYPTLVHSIIEKNYKAKLSLEKSCKNHFHTKKLLVKNVGEIDTSSSLDSSP